MCAPPLVECRFGGAEPLEFGADMVAGRDRELPGEGARHDVVAGPETTPVRAELAGEPRDGLQGMPEDGVAPPRADLGAVDGDAHADARKIETGGERHRRAEHEELLLRV